MPASLGSQPRQLLTPPVEEEGADGQSQHHDAGDDHALLDVDARRGGHAGGLGHLHQVPRQKGFTPQLHGIEVYCAGRTAQNGHAQRSKRRDAQHPVQQLPHQKQQQPCQQICPEMGENKADKGISGQ